MVLSGLWLISWKLGAQRKKLLTTFVKLFVVQKLGVSGLGGNYTLYQCFVKSTIGLDTTIVQAYLSSIDGQHSMKIIKLWALFPPQSSVTIKIRAVVVCIENQNRYIGPTFVESCLLRFEIFWALTRSIPSDDREGELGLEFSIEVTPNENASVLRVEIDHWISVRDTLFKIVSDLEYKEM